MANPQKFYLKHMFQKAAFRATWDPGNKLEIGMIGKLNLDGSFSPWSTLSKYGIEPEIQVDKKKGAVDYSSTEGISIEAKGEGKAPSVGGLLSETEAGFDIAFTSGRGVIFKAEGYHTDKIVNLEDIERAILEKYANNAWPKDYLIITSLVTAKTSTIIISTSDTSKLALKAKTGITAGQLDLTDVNVGLTLAKKEGSLFQFVTKQGLTPLYNAMGIRKPWFGDPHLRNRGGDDDDFTAMPFEEDEIPD